MSSVNSAENSKRKRTANDQRKKGALPDIVVFDSNCLDFRFIPEDKYLPKILTALMILAMVRMCCS